MLIRVLKPFHQVKVAVQGGLLNYSIYLPSIVKVVARLSVGNSNYHINYVSKMIGSK